MRFLSASLLLFVTIHLAFPDSSLALRPLGPGDNAGLEEELSGALEGWPTLRDRFKGYLVDLADEWSESEDPSERQWAPLVRKVSQRFDTEQVPLPKVMSVSVERNIEGNFVSDPETGFPKFTLRVNLTYIAEMFRLMEQLPSPEGRYTELLLRASLVKELGGIEYLKGHPVSGVPHQLLGEWLADRLDEAQEREEKEKGPSDRRSIALRLLKDARFVDLLKYYIAILGWMEGAGYLREIDYLASKVPPDALASLASSLAKLGFLGMAESVEGTAREVSLASLEYPERLRQLAVAHMFVAASQSLQEIPLYQEPLTPFLFRLAFLAELQEKGVHLDRYLEEPPPRLLHEDLHNPSAPSFMAYIRDPRYYDVTPDELIHRFGQSPQRESDRAGLEEAMAQIEQVLAGVPAGPVAEEALSAGQEEATVLREGV
jgi:hypothetical protein